MSLLVGGLILEVIGVLILAIVPMIRFIGGRREDLKFWQKRYWWHSWKPFYKNSQTLKWVISWKHKRIVDGIIPFKHKLNILGFLLFLTGAGLQLFFYLN